MGIRESLLNTITSVGNGDFIRIVTSAGASSKATVANLFKSFESGLGAKTSLTTSDYIRVVGSDNNAYKQSVSSVISSLGIDKLTGQLASSFSGDANTLTSTGQWQVGNPSNVTNLPSDANYGIMAVETARGYVYQRYIDANLVVYYRRSVDSGSNWSAWTKEPTRAEIDAVKRSYTGTTSFAALDPIHANDTRYLGGTLDAKVVAEISTFNAGVHTIHGMNNGPTFGIILDRTSNAYYGGLIWTYNADYGNTPWYFSYNNGTYALRPVAVPVYK